jgi:hypothetical protein
MKPEKGAMPRGINSGERSERQGASRWNLALLVTLLGLVACDRGASSAGQFEVQDSGNVRIVAYPDYPRNLPVWCVAAEPSLVLGSVQGPGPSAFGRISAVAERSDGVIVVADALVSEIRAFSSSGAHQWSAGGRGEGPGEYQSVSTVFSMPGDSVTVFDERLSRLTVLDSDGRTARTFSVAPPPDTYGLQILGGTRDGTLVGQSFLGPLGYPPAGWNRRRLALSFFDRDGTLLLVGREVPSSESFVRHGEMQGRTAYMSYVPRAARRTEIAVGNARVALTTQDRFEIREYGSHGLLEAILRIQVDPIVPTREIAAAYDTVPGPMPETMPALGDLYLDDQDRLWVEQFSPLGVEHRRVWWAFDSDGRALAEVSFPEDPWAVQHIASDHVLGVTSDSLGVEYVEKRLLLKPCTSR